MYEETLTGEEMATTSNNAEIVQVQDDQGGFDLSDMYVPRMNVCQPQSKDVEGNPGDLVIDKTIPIYKCGAKVPMFVISISKSWKEDIEYGSSETPRFARTLAEKVALEQELQEEGSRRRVIHFAEVTMLVAWTEECLVPKDDAPGVFPYNFGGTDFALVRMTFQKTAYDGTARRIVTYSTANPDKDLAAVPFYFSLAEKRNDKGRWFTPTMIPKLTESAPEELLAFVRNLKGGAR